MGEQVYRAEDNAMDVDEDLGRQCYGCGRGLG